MREGSAVCRSEADLQDSYVRLLSTSACLFWVSISVSKHIELLWFRVNAGEPKALQYRTYWTSVNATELYGTAWHARGRSPALRYPQRT